MGLVRELIQTAGEPAAESALSASGRDGSGECISRVLKVVAEAVSFGNKAYPIVVFLHSQSVSRGMLVLSRTRNDA